MAMNENAKAWVAALRSGEWAQAKRMLRNVKDGHCSFCCLGVASEMSKLGEWEGSCFQDHDQSAETAKRRFGKSFCDDCSGPDMYEEDHPFCPHEVKAEEFAAPLVQSWLGLASEDGALMVDGKKTSLAMLNDDGRSFAEIADIIEANQDQLFKG